MKTYQVIVMRPEWFIGIMKDIDTLQDLQYVATVEANTPNQAGKAAIAETLKSDSEDFGHHQLLASDYTVLGTLVSNDRYTPWLNGDIP